MGPALLRMVYYAATGVILSSISWGTISYSAITGDYLLSLILVGMMFYVVGNFFVDRWGLAGGPHDLHSTRLWKLPQTATPGDLWLRVVFNTLVGIVGYSALATIVVLVTTAHPAFMALLGALFLLRMPHLYWSMHGRYDRVPATHTVGDSRSVLEYRGGFRVDPRVRWIIPMGMAIVGAILAGAGMLLI